MKYIYIRYEGARVKNWTRMNMYNYACLHCVISSLYTQVPPHLPRIYLSIYNFISCTKTDASLFSSKPSSHWRLSNITLYACEKSVNEVSVHTDLFHGSTQSPQHFSKPSRFFSASRMSWLIWSMPSSIRSSCSEKKCE